MKKTFVVWMGVVVMSFSANAQDHPERRQLNPEKRAEWVINDLKEKVELPEVKWEQLAAIKEEYMTGIKALRSEKTGRPEKAEIKALKDRQDAKMKEVLSEEEYAGLMEAMQEMRPERRRGHPGRRPIDPEQRAERIAASLKEHVELSEEKWTQFTAINKEYFAEIKKERAQATGRPDRPVMMELKQHRDEKLKVVLTADEFASLQQAERELRSKGHKKGKNGKRNRPAGKRNSR